MMSELFEENCSPYNLELATRRGIALNNVGVSLLERTSYNAAWTTCYNAIQIMKHCLPSNPTSSVSSNIINDVRVEGMMRKAREALYRTKVVSSSSWNVPSSARGYTSTRSSSRLIDLNDCIQFDPHSIPDLDILLRCSDSCSSTLHHSHQRYRPSHRIRPIKMDMLQDPGQDHPFSSSSLMSREVVSAVILYNLALVNTSLDAPPSLAVAGSTYHPPTAGDVIKSIKLLTLSLDLIQKKLDATIAMMVDDVAEQVGLLFLSIVIVRAILGHVQHIPTNSTSNERRSEFRKYETFHGKLMRRAQTLATLEVVVLQTKPVTAPVA